MEKKNLTASSSSSFCLDSLSTPYPSRERRIYFFKKKSEEHNSIAYVCALGAWKNWRWPGARARGSPNSFNRLEEDINVSEWSEWKERERERERADGATGARAP